MALIGDQVDTKVLPKAWHSCYQLTKSIEQYQHQRTRSSLSLVLQALVQEKAPPICKTAQVRSIYNGEDIAPLEDKGLQPCLISSPYTRQESGLELPTEINTGGKNTKTFGHCIKPRVLQGAQIKPIFKGKKKTLSLNLCLQSLLKLYKKNPQK